MKDVQKTLVDINQGSIDELISLRGIGESLAQRIIDQRPYQALEELTRVPGINQVKLASLAPFITIVKTEVPASPREKQPKRDVIASDKPVATLGTTEAFVFLEDRNERQDALLILFGGFILGLLILLLRRSSKQN